MPVKLDDLLITATAHFASDLHLKVGSFPVMRIGGELHPIADAPRLTPDDTLDMAFSIMSNRQKQKLKECSEVDIAYSVNGLGRFRANIFQQRGTVSIVLRVIPEQTKNAAGLGLPPVIERICEERRGLILVTAETGHLVLSTLHTLDATETVTRIVSSFPSHQQKSVRIQLAGILKAVISMRLVRSAKGSGRVPAVEVLVSTGLIRDYIINEEKTYMIREAIAHGASQYGMQTFDQSLFTLLQSGRISLEEAIHNATNPDEFKMRVSGIMSTEQAIRAEGNLKRDVAGTGREPIESVIVKL